MKDRAAVILIRDEKILLVWRHKNDEKYFCFPGGQIKKKWGETPAEAALREMTEETGIDVWGLHPAWMLQNQGRTEYYYLASNWNDAADDIQFCGNELQRQSSQNEYRLEWMPLNALPNLRILPEEVKAMLLELSQRTKTSALASTV